MAHSTRTVGRNVASVGAAGLAFALALTGCTTSGGSSGGDASQIRSVFAADPHSFLPWEASAVDDYLAASLMYQPLVFKDDGNEFIPGLATEWDVTPEQATFTIREGAVCGDGTEITPTIVADSLNQFAEHSATFASTTFGAGTPTITADDAAHTVTVDLAQPWTDVLSGLALPASGIVCPAGLADTDGTAAGTVDAAVTGPYTLAKKQAGVQYEFALRDDYDMWPAYKKPLEGTPAQELLFSVNSEGSGITNELLTGTMDVAIVRGKDMMRLEEAKNVNTERIPAANLFLLFNEREGHPFADEAKRRAVAQAMNREAFNQATNGGLGELAASFALPAVPCYNQDDALLIPEDQAAAATALDGVKVRVLGSQAFGPNGAANTYVAEALRAAGADVSLENVDNATWAANGMQKPESWDLIVFANVNAAATMWGVMSLFVGAPTEDGGANWTGNADDARQALVNEAMQEADPEKRCAIYADAQKGLIEEARVVPLSTMASMVGTREGFTMRSPNKSRADMTMRVTN
ncbi:ABC transporter substrate-binding protein [Leucobacter sp. HY1910]